MSTLLDAAALYVVHSFDDARRHKMHADGIVTLRCVPLIRALGYFGSRHCTSKLTWFYIRLAVK